MKKDLIIDDVDLFNEFELIPRIEENWFDVLDYIRPNVESFALYCKQKYNTKEEYKAIFNNYPYDLLASSLIDIDISSGWLRFAFNDNSIKWLKEQRSAFIFVPSYFHPFNNTIMMLLRFYRNATDKILDYVYSYEDDFWCGLYSYDVINNELNDYLKEHHYFLDFAEALKKDMAEKSRAELINKYAVGDYFNILFLQQYLYTSCKTIYEFYTAEIVELCAEILIERYKLKQDINLFDSLCLWLAAPISINKTDKYDDSAGWRKVMEFLVSLDKNLVCDIVTKIITNSLTRDSKNVYDIEWSQALVYNLANVFKQINSPYNYIQDKRVLDVLKYFEPFDLKDNFYLDENASFLFKSDIFKNTLLKY